MRSVMCVVTVMLAVYAGGCGGDREAPSPEQAAPFAEAIAQYFRANSMGMKVDHFESLSVREDSATADVRVSDQDVGYGLKPLWEFSFRKADRGWTVTEHRSK
jgi:hypothetical protein